MSGIKSALAWPNGKAYLFDKENGPSPGVSYVRHDFVSGARDQGQQNIAANWRGLRATRPDAAVYWGFGKVYFFYGDEYLRYDVGADAVDPEYLLPNPPRKIAGNWNMPWTDRLDCGVNWGNGKVYFFRDGEYLRYDVTLDRADANYPKPIAGNWNGIWTERIDAVLYQGGTKAYFFRGDEYRRFDLALDGVDETGSIDALQLDPVPAGLWTPARELTPPQANSVMGYLIQSGKLSLGENTPYRGDWQSGITSPSPATRVVVKPPLINNVQFAHEGLAPQPIDNLDQRMLIALYRLAGWLNASEPTVSVLRHLGIGHGNGPPTDCHNQGRALDFAGIEGTSLGANFERKVLHDWGQLPAAPGAVTRLDPARDALSHDLFRAVLRFASFECECNGIGGTNHFPPKELGDPGGFVAHPEYVDEPAPARPLRGAHQNHVHMQVGPT